MTNGCAYLEVDCDLPDWCTAAVLFTRRYNEIDLPRDVKQTVRHSGVHDAAAGTKAHVVQSS